MPGADQSPQSNAQPGQFVGKFLQTIYTDYHFLTISKAVLYKLVHIHIKSGGGGNSKKVNTHPKIPEIDLDFFRLF